MNCEGARDHMVLAAYGELPDEEAIGLELHLASCQECLQELNTLREMDALMALHPMTEPDPNFLAQSRMKLDEALDAIPQGSAWMIFRANAGAWWGHLSGAPALATLLVGVGFIGGHLTHRYQVNHAAKVPFPMVLTDTTGGGIRTVTGVQSLPNDMVQVSFERMVPEMAQGSLDDPQIKKLLMVGTMAAATPVVRLDSVGLLADQCKLGHACRSADGDEDGDVRKTLLTALRTDKSPVVRMKVLEGLQPYVSQDERVRDAVSQALLTDASLAVRTKAVAVLQPVHSDTSVRQALRTVSTTDVNPYLRTVSMQALGDSASLQ